MLSNPFTERIDSLESRLSAYAETDTSLPYIDLLFELGEAWHSVENLKKAFDYYDQSKKVAEKAKHWEHVYYALITTGEICYRLADFPCSIERYIHALDEYSQYASPADSAYIFRQLGYVEYHLGDLSKAYEFHLKSLKIGERISDSIIIANYYYAAALVDSEQQQQLKKGLENLWKALRLFQNANLDMDVSDCYVLIGETYHSMDSLSQAIKYKSMAMKIDSASGYQYGIAYCSFSLADTYIKMGKLDKALELNERALSIRKKLNDQEEIIESITAIGVIYKKKGDYAKALEYFEKAMSLAIDLNVKPLIKDIYKELSDVWFLKKRYRKAFEFLEKHHQLNDSLFNEKTVQNISNLSAGYEIERREHTISLLKKEQQIAQLEGEKRITILKWTAAIVSLVFLAILILAGFYQYRKQLYFNRTLKSKNEQIENQNQNLTETVKKLENANRDLEQFAYISSHDLKAPLRSIGSFTKLLQRRYGHHFDEDANTFMKYVVSSVKQMNTLLDDIMNFSHIKESQVEFKRVNTNEVLLNVIQSLMTPSKQDKSTIVSNELPAVLGNSIQIQQLFQNLIDNALKFIPSDITPKIEIKAKPVDKMIRFSIADNGIGIEKPYQEKIFSAFKRLNSLKEYEGSGVGLAICQKIARKHGGDIWVESDGKTGSTFYFTLRAAQINGTKNVLVPPK